MLQAGVVVGLPFVRIGGESALRLDIPTGRLHAFGASFTIDEAFVVLAATLLATAAFLLVTLLLGRAWCGWACPQTVLADLTAPALRLRAPRPATGGRLEVGREVLALALVTAASALVAANLLWYFVSPYEFLPRLAAGTLGPVLGVAWGVLTAILVLDLVLVRARFCATACPYAKLQGVLFDGSTLVVAYDRRRERDCIDCGACVRVCPTGIDIRDGLQAECIACAACIDACAPIMARLGRPPGLVGYCFGAPGGAARPFRPAAVALGTATAAAAALLVAVLAGRSLLGLGVSAEEGFAARRAADGWVVNAYRVGLENRGRRPVHVTLGLSSPGVELSLRPGEVELGPGERRSVRVVATARGLAPGRALATLSAEAHAGDELVARRTEKVPIAAPEGS